ncbi:MAG: hypothetical protein RSA79_07205, partial [Oscillospiraceae bacterium]
MIEIYGEKLDKTIVEFLNIYAFQFDSQRDIQANSFYIDVAFQAGFCDFFKVKVIVDTKEIFSGFVDSEENIVSKDGHFLRLFCRNQASLLLDNEVKPQFYFKLSSDQIFNEFAKPFGIKSIK